MYPSRHINVIKKFNRSIVFAPKFQSTLINSTAFHNFARFEKLVRMVKTGNFGSKKNCYELRIKVLVFQIE